MNKNDLRVIKTKNALFETLTNLMTYLHTSKRISNVEC